MSDATTVAPPSAPSVADLQAEISAAREQLVATLNELKSQTKPAALAKRGQQNALGFFTDEFGGVRPERVAMAGAVVIGLIVIGMIRRARR
jgi:hypothetical protein